MNSPRIVAIDPGTHESAFVVWDGHQIIEAEIYLNEAMEQRLQYRWPVPVYCEMIASYGMPVGKEVFETCLWIGEFRLQLRQQKEPFTLVYRRDVKLHHCGSARAKDGNVIQALKDKYGAKGTKANPGTTYKLKSHLWQAFAIATMVTEQRIQPGEVTK